MAYPLDNLGNYNIVRNALKEADGNAENLFKKIGDTAVAEASPEIFKDGCLTGIGIGVGICSVIYAGYSYYKNKKNEKKALNAELKLKEELTKTIENTKTEIDEPLHQN
mgnify:CR=1 FL=1